MKRFAFTKLEAKCIRAARFEVSIIARRLSRQRLPRPADTYHALSGFADPVLVYLMATSKSSSIKQQVSAYFDIYQQTKPVITGAHLKAIGFTEFDHGSRVSCHD